MDNSALAYSAKFSSTGAPELHDRLIQLERLVVSLMTESASKGHTTPGSDAVASSRLQIVPPSDATADHVDERSECGSMRICESQFRHVGGNHWAAILDGIADLKDHLDRDEQIRLANTQTDADQGNDFAKPRSGDALLLYGGRRLVSREEILVALPPKPAVDRYISRYFNYLDLVSSCEY